MVLRVGYTGNSLSAFAFIISIGLISAALDMRPGPVYGGSVDENIATLLDTKKCPGCDLHGADLNGAELFGADLRGADLTGANLNGADLSGGADLSNVNFSNANLTDADLTGANLNGANLTGAIVENTAFVGVKGLTPEQKEDLRKRSAIVMD